MEYFQEVLDRSSGQLLRVSQGDWITITELGDIMGAGRRETRAILRAMNFLVVEGQGRNARHRLAPWVTDRGWGRRIKRTGCFPFDVLGPNARTWVERNWQSAAEDIADLSDAAKEAQQHFEAFLARRRNSDMPPQEQVCWLCDFYPELSQAEKGRIVGISQQLVSRFEQVRRRQLERKRIARDRQLL